VGATLAGLGTESGEDQPAEKQGDHGGKQGEGFDHLSVSLACPGSGADLPVPSPSVERRLQQRT